MTWPHFIEAFAGGALSDQTVRAVVPGKRPLLRAALTVALCGWVSLLLNKVWGFLPLSWWLLLTPLWLGAAGFVLLLLVELARRRQQRIFRVVPTIYIVIPVNRSGELKMADQGRDDARD